MVDWFETTIGDQVTLQRGFDITRKDQRPGRFPVISSGGIASFHDEPRVKGPGVVLGRKGVVGSVYFHEEDFWPHDTTLWVRDFHGNNERFVYYFFIGFSQQLASLDVGSANPTLNRNHVHPIRVSWPTKDTQIRIADILGSLDDKIELNRRMNATLEGMAQAIFRDWFVDFGPTRRKQAGVNDPVEIMGCLLPDPTRAQPLADLFPASIGDNGLPEGWEERPLLDCASLISGGTPKTSEPTYWNGKVSWASAKDVSQCSDPFLLGTERSITELGLQKSSTKIIPKFATVVVARGATTGRYCMFGDSFAMNQTCYALSSCYDTPFWLYGAFSNVVARLVQSAHGSVFDTITTKTLERASVPAHCACITNAYEDVVKAIWSRAFIALQENQNLAEMRDLLLPKLMSGEIRAGEAERMMEDAA